MYANYQDTVKVDESIKPIHFSKRVKPELIIGASYYFSFDGKIAIPGELVEIIEDRKMIKISAIINKERDQICTHQLFWDEIGLTPEEAVVNMVTM